MKDIAVILPIHLWNEDIHQLSTKALDSVAHNRKTYTLGNIYSIVVAPSNIIEDIKKCYVPEFTDTVFFVENTSESVDFCSQINLGVTFIKEKMSEDITHFSILEFDDYYADNWFKMASDYYDTNEDVSVFLPVNILHNQDNSYYSFMNELVLATSFSNELNFIDYDCLQNCSLFNLTGGLFNIEDFISVGQFKPSIQVAFSYEFLLRITNKGLKVMVVPKEGYYHLVNRENSLTDIYNKTMDENQMKKWFDLAKRECKFEEDRKKTIINTPKVELK